MLGAANASTATHGCDAAASRPGKHAVTRAHRPVSSRATRPPHQPYIDKPGAEPRLAAASARMEAELAAIKRMLEDCAAKGKLAAYMQVRRGHGALSQGAAPRCGCAWVALSGCSG